MTNTITKKRYNLKERIFAFVLRVIHLVNQLPDTKINRIFIGQVVRSSSSVGSNYEEADGTPTKKDFIYKMGLVKKEAKETKYWITLIKASNPASYLDVIDLILEENEELIKIFSSIIIKSKS